MDEINAYGLCVQLRDRIFTLTERGPAARDFDFRNQIRSSSASAASNLSEGFARYAHGQFGYHANVAKASLAETINHIDAAKHRGYFTADEHRTLMDLAEEAKRTTAGLARYLRNSVAPGESQQSTRRKPQLQPTPQRNTRPGEITNDD